MRAVFDKAVGWLGTPCFGAAAAPSTMFGKPLLGSSAPRECVFNAALCCYTSVSPDDVLIGCRGEDELLCVHTRYCLASGDKAFPVSLECSPEEIMRNRGGTVCELSLAAAALKVKMPSTLYRHHDRFFCLRSAGAFPLQDPVPTPVCAFCCCRVLPRPMGPLAPPLGGKPTTNLIMRR